MRCSKCGQYLTRARPSKISRWLSHEKIRSELIDSVWRKKECLFLNPTFVSHIRSSSANTTISVYKRNGKWVIEGSGRFLPNTDRSQHKRSIKV